MSTLALLLFGLAGCGSDEGFLGTPTGTWVEPTEPDPTETTPTADTGHTGTAPTLQVDCGNLPEPPFAFTEVNLIQTEEDFDFDAEGYLVAQDFTNILGTLRTGQQKTIAVGVGIDAAGLRTLPSGDLVVAQPDTGEVVLVYHQTGGSKVVAGGLTFPNGLEVSPEGEVFVSEYTNNGRIRILDPYTGDFEVLVSGYDYPNGMALTPDGQRLYVVSSASLFWGDGRIQYFEKGADGEWDPTPHDFYMSPTQQTLDGITVDSCGNVYVVEYSTGKLVRIVDETGEYAVVADLGSGWQYPSMRWGHGIGDWDVDKLYVTGRTSFFEVEAGIAGKPHVLFADDG